MASEIYNEKKKMYVLEYILDGIQRKSQEKYQSLLGQNINWLWYLPFCSI